MQFMDVIITQRFYITNDYLFFKQESAFAFHMCVCVFLSININQLQDEGASIGIISVKKVL